MKHNDKMENLKEWNDTTKNQEFTYPMWFKHKKWDYIVKFTDLRHGIVVVKGTNLLIDKDFSFSRWTAHTDSKTWEKVENPNKELDKIDDDLISEMESLKEPEDTAVNKESEQPLRGDGGSVNYYELPKGATELRHLIRYKKMSHSIGEIFCAIYRLNDNGEYLRNLKKAKFYIDSEIEEYEKEKTK